MKHMPFIIVVSLFALVSCTQEKSKTVNNNTSSSADNYCIQYPTAGSCVNNNTGSSNGGSTGGTTGGTPNPYPQYNSYYADKYWQVEYPHLETIPSTKNSDGTPKVDCSAAIAPTGIPYTPYETRKGTITMPGAGFGNGRDPSSSAYWYDPRTYSPISDDRTSTMLQNPVAASNFFWTDSALKIRLKANLQPDDSESSVICKGRIPGSTATNKSTVKGYTRIKFDLWLVGIKKDSGGNIVSYYEPELLRAAMVLDINKCSTPIDLASFNGINYPSKYPDGLFLQVRNVKGNQEWSPGTMAEQQQWDYNGYYPKSLGGNSYYDGNSYMKAIRSNDCWSLDIEVAADGTKTF